MTLLIQDCPLRTFTPLFDTALSSSGRSVRNASNEALDFGSSISLSIFRVRLFHALEVALYEYTQEINTDQEASPLDYYVINHTVRFISQLPTNYPLPSFGVDNDGAIAIDWDCGPRKIISLRIERDGTINYAGLDGHSTFHGVESFRENIPAAIDNAIRRIIQI